MRNDPRRQPMLMAMKLFVLIFSKYFKYLEAPSSPFWNARYLYFIITNYFCSTWLIVRGMLVFVFPSQAWSWISWLRDQLNAKDTNMEKAYLSIMWCHYQSADEMMFISRVSHYTTVYKWGAVLGMINVHMHWGVATDVYFDWYRLHDWKLSWDVNQTELVRKRAIKFSYEETDHKTPVHQQAHQSSLINTNLLWNHTLPKAKIKMLPS